MDTFAEIRLRGREAHHEAFSACASRAAPALVAAAARLRDIEIVAFAPGTRFEEGVLGMYERVGRLVSIDRTLPPGLRERVIAHEIGHHDLHRDPVEATSDGDLDPESGIRALGYSRRERREMEAEVFAVELLCPGDWLREEIVERERQPDAIAADLGLPDTWVAAQALRVLCLPTPESPEPCQDACRSLTAEQRRAATWGHGNLLVRGGPGTGKTTTLVGRVLHLLSFGVEPARILALTFSTQAASDLRGRIEHAIASGDGPWIGTLHAFGSEVIHGWHERMDRGPDPKILDRRAAADLIKGSLDDFPLRSEDLSEGAGPEIADLLALFGRCKAAMIDPREFAAAASEACFDGSWESDGIDRIAAAYSAYERLLERHGAVDLDDLVFLAARLFEENDDIAIHYGKRFSHVLVDEAQDLDPAATRLLQSLCGPGTCLWAAGDANQCIHRFRGAEPAAMANFSEMFGGENLDLTVNLRNAPAIAAACARFMAETDGSEEIDEAHLDIDEPGLSIRIGVTATFDDEMDFVRCEIGRLIREGSPLCGQAVLARTHRDLDILGEGLSLRGVPVLHIGDLLARDDVKRLMAVLAVACRDEPSSLLRLIDDRSIAIRRVDALAVVRKAAETHLSALEILRQPAKHFDVDPATASEFTRLARTIDDLSSEGTDAAAILSHRAFATLKASANAGNAPARLAALALVRLAGEERMDAEGFMAKVRRLVALDAGRDLGAITPEMEHERHVRMLTIHASKGLEFDAVHLPMMSAAHMPLARNTPPQRMPPDLARVSSAAPRHRDDERALFLVAMSRARADLSISFSRQQGSRRNLKPSPFLAAISDVAGTADVFPRDTFHAGPTQEPDLHPPTRRTSYRVDALETYAACPARYRFEHVDGLAETLRPGVEARAMAAALAALREIDGMRHEGPPSQDDVDATMSITWAEHGLAGIHRETEMHRKAKALVDRVAHVPPAEAASFRMTPAWRIGIADVTVEAVPDRVIVHSWDYVTIQIATLGDGTPTPLAWRAALMLIAAQQAFPGMRALVEAVAFDNDDRIHVEPADEDATVERYRSLVERIEAGLFPPARNPRACAECPFLVACGA